MNINNLKKLNFSIIFLILSYIAILTFIRYKGNYHPFYIDIWSYFRGNENFITNDLYVPNSVIASSKIYKFFALLNINIDNDLVGYISHLLFSLIGYYFCYKIVAEFLHKDKKEFAIVISLSLALFDNILLDGPQSGWVSAHSGTQTLYIHALTFPLIWLAIKNKWMWVSLISSIGILFSVKVIWFPTAICFFYSLIKDKKINFLNAKWIVLPFATLLYLFTETKSKISLTNDPAEKSELFNQVININMHEEVFHLQNKWLFFAFLLSMVLYWLLLKKYKKNSYHFKFLYTVLILSLGLTVFGFIYGLIGKSFFSDPRILLLSPVRSVATYQLFFGILVSMAVIKSRLTILSSAGILASWIYFYLGNLLLPVLLVSCFVFNFLPKKNNFGYFSNFLKLNNSNNSNKYIIKSFLLIVLPIILVTFYGKIKSFDYDGFKKIKQWTAGYSKESQLFDGALKLNACSDFILIPLSKNQNKNHYHEFRNNFFPYSKLNYISKKSKYIGAITSFYLNLDLQKEHYRRVKILNSFLYSMSNDKKISEQVLEEFKKKNIVLIGYKNFFNEIPNTENIEKFLISKNIEAVYFSKEKNKKIIQCLNKAKI